MQRGTKKCTPASLCVILSKEFPPFPKELFMKRASLILSAFVFSATLFGCSTVTVTKTEQCTAGGAGVGALVGGPIGAVAGAVIGHQSCKK